MAPTAQIVKPACITKRPLSWADVVDDDENERERLLAQQAVLKDRLSRVKSELVSLDDDKSHHEKLDANRKKCFELVDVMYALKARVDKVEASIRAGISEYLHFKYAEGMKQHQAQLNSAPPMAAEPVKAESVAADVATVTDDDAKEKDRLLAYQTTLKERLAHLKSQISKGATDDAHYEKLCQGSIQVFELADIKSALKARTDKVEASIHAGITEYLQLKYKEGLKQHQAQIVPAEVISDKPASHDDDHEEKACLLEHQAALKERLAHLKSQISKGATDDAHYETLHQGSVQVFKLADVKFALKARTDKVEASIHVGITEYLQLKYKEGLKQHQVQIVPAEVISDKPASRDDDHEEKARLLEHQAALKERLANLKSQMPSSFDDDAHYEELRQGRAQVFELTDLLQMVQERVHVVESQFKTRLSEYIKDKQKAEKCQKKKRAKKAKRQKRAH